MTMTEHERDVLNRLDFRTVRCQCEQHPCTSRGGCPNPATEHIEFHALDHCNQTETLDGETINPFGNHVFLLCLDCLHTLAHTVTHYLDRLNRYGRPTCLTCGAPAVELSDVIREVKTL